MFSFTFGPLSKFYYLHQGGVTINIGQKKSLFIHLVYNGDLKADRSGARLPV